MTQEEKAKAYDEALKRAREWHNDSHITIGLKGNLEDIFPELKESGDIRKRIIDALHGDVLEMGEIKKAIAWLEKQGEQPKEATYTHEVETGNGNIKALVTEKVQLPRFKVNDWVVSKLGNVWHIDSFDNKNYKVTDINGNHNCFPIYIQDRLHLYTHQDAKDGDVLVASPIKGQEGKEQIFIFKGINSRDYVDNCIEYYCRICDGVFYENENGYMGTTSSPIYPATKEQRDALFAKMKEAGYEWDAEKKDLKKISQRMVSAEAKEALYDNPAWSEEDEVRFESCIKVLQTSDGYDTINTKWFKSLKERVQAQPKQEWSEEDEKNLQGIIDEIQANKSSAPSYDINVYDRYLSWLKSLRPQKQWKPSDEQLYYLHWIANIKLGDSVVEQEVSKHLNELYNDLKKL